MCAHVAYFTEAALGRRRKYLKTVTKRSTYKMTVTKAALATRRKCMMAVTKVLEGSLRKAKLYL